MSDELVIYEKHDTAAVVTMNRPKKRNALSTALVKSLTDGFERAGADEFVRSVILTGAAPAFCAGLDLTELTTASSGGAPDLMPQEAAESLMKLFETIEHLPKPTIAAVNGHAIAGGAGLMTTCDMVIASHDARIGYPEVKRGLVAVIVMTYLCRQVGDRAARHLLLTGDLTPAVRAETIGLVNWAVPPGKVMPNALDLAEGLRECGPKSLALTKKLLADLQTLPPDKRRQWAVEWNADMRRQEEAIEGVAAFRQKRKPNWAT